MQRSYPKNIEILINIRNKILKNISYNNKAYNVKIYVNYTYNVLQRVYRIL